MNPIDVIEERILLTGLADRRPVDAETGDLLRLNADFAVGGVWAGVDNLVEMAYLDLLRSGHMELIDRYNYELHMALPKHRAALPLGRPSLTDFAKGSEKTRNFPLDRAYRIVHGLVEFVASWRAMCADERELALVVAHLDHAGHLAARFFAELARRFGSQARLTVLIEREGRLRRLDDHQEIDPQSLPGYAVIEEEVPALDEAAARALEARLRLPEASDAEAFYPILLNHHRRTGDRLAGARVALMALGTYNHLGYYHEAARFADTVLAYFDALVGNDETERWNIVGNIFQAFIMTGELPRAQKLIETAAVPYLTEPALRAKMSYVLSMIHLRYATLKNLVEAEHHIVAAQSFLEQGKGEIPAHDYVFYKVFIENGLAFLRVRQGRHLDAVALCETGYDMLTRELGDEAHRLHRSVLQYNVAQVYAMLGDTERAIGYYRKCSEMDPFYSEYYNEAGNLLQRSGAFGEALEAYDRAIACSPPYPEVFFNKAICHAHLQQWEGALDNCSRSLDLDPSQPEALLLRAEILEALGHEADGAADIDRAIALFPGLVTARVNRAVNHFNSDKFALALDDLNIAIANELGDPSLYRSRAEIHKALGKQDLYDMDLSIAARLIGTA